MQSLLAKVSIGDTFEGVVETTAPCDSREDEQLVTFGIITVRGEEVQGLHQAIVAVSKKMKNIKPGQCIKGIIGSSLTDVNQNKGLCQLVVENDQGAQLVASVTPESISPPVF